MQQRNFTGQILGIATFLGGVALLLLTFRIAYDLFQRPAADVLGIKAEQTIDVNFAGRSAIELLFRIALLLLMCIVGSVVANRGIRMYQAAIGEMRHKPSLVEQSVEPEPATPEEP